MTSPEQRRASGAVRGRRRGTPDTRGAILTAARRLFAERGYRATTMRAVAAAAEVDAALVHHYFGTKEDLFVASLDISVDPREAIPAVFAPGIDGAGERLLATVLGVWDQPERRRPLVAVLRRSLGDPGDVLMRDGFLRLVLGTLREALPRGDAVLRVQLVATQILGLVMSRYVLELEPLASMPRAEVVRAVGPTLQRYLDGPLS